MAILQNSNLLPVLIIWAMNNNYAMPLHDPFSSSVTIDGATDAQILSAITGKTQSDIDAANVEIELREFHLLKGKPVGDFAELKTWAVGAINSSAEKIRHKATKGAGAIEVSGWVDKSFLAEKIIATTASAAEIAIIQAEADLRGLNETAVELSATIVVKANALRTIRSHIDGFQDKALNDINAAVDEAALNAMLPGLIATAVTIVTSLNI